ncbi:hypothetical protein V0R50_06940 [Pseudomonas sp. 148P]|uniref:Uncharacterized protein n=1 Tax=Pseudomonas ulcerans TaxID=3115852 RepID=A0ABU7HN39_9PSED|nr:MULTISPECIES: hypothetical protein [unclassified Pseudomonas]MEE1922476.1 hypothetical protein [Pseudomonas sp. 147P]MEE1932950.1 hypothetical protein [Pseudomonas sp. 148P]
MNFNDIGTVSAADTEEQPLATPADREAIARDRANTATALSSSETVSRYGSANAEFVKAYTGVDNEHGVTLSKGLKGISQENTGVKHRAGWAAEVASTSRENAEAIINKSSERSIRSDDLKHYGIETDGTYRQAVDRVRVDENGQIVYEAQTKVEANGNRVANQVSHEDHKYSKYFGKKLELPSEQVEEAKTYCRTRAQNLRTRADKLDSEGKPEVAAKFRERADRFDKLADEDIVDLGLDTTKAIDYAERPLRETLKDIARTSHRAGVEGAKYGALIGGGISLLSNAFKVAQDTKELDEAARDLAIDTAKAAALGYGTAFAGSALKGAMQQSGNQTLRTLSGTNAPALVVNICLSLTTSIHRYINDDISEAQLLEELGEKGTGMLSSSMMAVLGQIAVPIPFVGAAIGGMIGYTLASTFYQCAFEAARSVELSRRQLERARMIQAAARERIAEEQARLDEFTRREIPQLRNETAQLFVAVNGADSDAFAVAINQYATLLGKQLEFSSQSEFDAFMDSDGPLVL